MRSRRSFPAGIAVVIASPAAAIPGSDDRGLLDLCGEVTRLRHEADLIEVQRVWPHDDEIERILCGTGPRKERIEAAELYAVESGHREASNDVSRLLARADGLMEQMLAMPANTVVGRRAKVEVLLAHLDEPNWRASDEEAGWEFRAVRTLLRELISI